MIEQGNIHVYTRPIYKHISNVFIYPYVSTSSKCDFIVIFPSLCFYFLEGNIVENWYNCLLKCMLHNNSPMKPNGHGTLGEGINYWFKWKRQGYLGYFFLVVCIFQGLVFFKLVITFVGIELSTVFCYCPFNVLSISNDDLSFISDTLVICVFFLFLFTWAKILLILLIFPKPHLWDFNFFLISVFNFNDFCYNFNYLISSCCFRFNLVFFCSCLR